MRYVLDSPRFSNFRELIDRWDEEVANDKLTTLLDGLGLILFFEKDKEIFGAGEDSRVVFAKLKNPDDELPSGWEDEANFSAYNLNKLLSGQNAHHVFDKEGVKNINVIDREEAYDKLRKSVGELDSPQVNMFNLDSMLGKNKDPDEAPNFIYTKERD